MPMTVDAIIEPPRQRRQVRPISTPEGGRELLPWTAVINVQAILPSCWQPTFSQSDSTSLSVSGLQSISS